MIFNLERKTMTIPHIYFDEIWVVNQLKIILDEIIDKTVIVHKYLISSTYKKIITIISNNFVIQTDAKGFYVNVTFTPNIAMINIDLHEYDFIPQVRDTVVIGSDRVISIGNNKEFYQIDTITKWIPSLMPGKIFNKNGDNNTIIKIISVAINPNNNNMIVVYEEINSIISGKILFLPIEEFIDLIK